LKRSISHPNEKSRALEYPAFYKFVQNDNH